MNEDNANTEAPGAQARNWQRCLDIPEIGIEFKRYHSPQFERFVAAWHNDYDSHVYELEVRQSDAGWTSRGTTDGESVFAVSAAGRNAARLLGLAAMRAHLVRGHKRTWRKARAAARTAEVEG